MAKKSGIVGTVVTGGIVLLVGYYAYRWLRAPHAAQAQTGSSFVGGPYGGSIQGAQGGSTNALLDFLGKLLGGKQQGKGGPGSGLSFGGGSGSGLAGLGLSDAAQREALAIGQFSSLANNTPLSELGGASLLSYAPSYLDSSQLDYQPLQGFDLNQLATDIPSIGDFLYGAGGGGGGYSGGLDTTSYTGPDSIDPVDYQTFDVSQMAY